MIDLKGLNEEQLNKIKTLVEEFKKVNNTRFYVPKVGKEYWFMKADGYIGWYVNGQDKTDVEILANQEVFRTKEQAKRELKVRKATVRLKKRISELNDGWKPNWQEGNQDKFYFAYDFEDGKAFIINTYITRRKHHQNWRYLKSGELVRQLIEEMEEDILLYLGVE